MLSIAKSGSHAVYSLKLHVVFVTKYRRKVLTPSIIADLRTAFAEILHGWRCGLIEFGAEADHVHLLIEIHPALNIATLINNLKSASSKRIQNAHRESLLAHYGKPALWHAAYYVSSVGGATLETIRRYVEAQGVDKRKKPQPTPA